MTSFIIKAQASRPVPEFWRQDGESRSARLRIYEDDQVIAFLDILPLRPGHTLVVPKFHCARASVGKAISRISNALTKAVDNTALNVVCNQEYAQVVPHVHYHIIPAPRSSTTRDDLDEDAATALVERIRAHL
ncbi:HIT-like domain-containing protein [Lactarius deliciosus]|nr:HIT-like domain-containing protein [Lactarius deliciosus]